MVPSVRRGWIWNGLGAVVVLVASAFWFYHDLEEEPFFADESADIAQTYYYQLAKTGDWNHADWVHPAAYDHLPVFKYLIGGYLDMVGYGDKIPRSTSSWEWWITGHFDAPSDPGLLRAARIPMLWGAVFGCVMIHVLGCQAVGPKTGLLAAGLLALSPVYYTHARRAMADDLTQGLVMAGLAAFIALVKWRNGAAALRQPTGDAPSKALFLNLRFWCLAVSCGIAAGLAAATKLNGAVLTLALAFFTVLAVIAATFPFRNGLPRGRQRLFIIGVGGIVASVSLIVFVGLNPYFFARPEFDEAGRAVGASKRRSPEFHDAIREVASLSLAGRFRQILVHRVDGLKQATVHFEDDMLPSVRDRLRAMVVEGMGRWTAIGLLPLPTRGRVLVAVVLVTWGLLCLALDGIRDWRAARIPWQWLMVLWPLAETAMLAKTLVINWDRYYLGVVAWSSLLFAVAVAHVAMLLTPKWNGKRQDA